MSKSQLSGFQRNWHAALIGKGHRAAMSPPVQRAELCVIDRPATLDTARPLDAPSAQYPHHKNLFLSAPEA
jgi:hypothetical protein